MTPAAVIEDGEGVQPARPRRRRVSHRAEVELRADGQDAPHPRYLVVNADEMEPGTFKDRLLMEGDPHQLIEGMILARVRHRGDVAYIFLRGEYKLAGAAAGHRPSPRPTRAGYLGKNILGSGYSLEMHLHLSAGRYMCGEETGLLNALEGKRANPRAKPPFPAGLAASGASRPSSTTSRRCATCRTSSTTARSGSRA